jgi:hypothetical protein
VLLLAQQQTRPKVEELRCINHGTVPVKATAEQQLIDEGEQAWTEADIHMHKC